MRRVHPVPEQRLSAIEATDNQSVMTTRYRRSCDACFADEDMVEHADAEQFVSLRGETLSFP